MFFSPEAGQKLKNPAEPTIRIWAIQPSPWKMSGWNLQPSPMKGKGSEPNLHEDMCKMSIFRGVYIFYTIPKTNGWRATQKMMGLGKPVTSEKKMAKCWVL